MGQVLGDVDVVNGQSLSPGTASKYGVRGADLGYPVDEFPTASADLGRQFFLFGDTLPSDVDPLGQAPPLPPYHTGYTNGTAGTWSIGSFPLPSAPPRDADSIAYCSGNSPTSALALQFLHAQAQPGDWAPNRLAETPIKIDGSVAETNGVPYSGFSDSGGSLYVFWALTAHSVDGSQLDPFDVCQPLDGIGQRYRAFSRLARLNLGDSSNTSATVATLRDEFYYVSPVVVPTSILRLVNPPANITEPYTVVFFGKQIDTTPYLAIAPYSTAGDPSTWSYLKGFTQQQPTFNSASVTSCSLSPRNVCGTPGPCDVPLWTEPGAASACAGPGGMTTDIQVTYEPHLQKWLMIHNSWQAAVADPSIHGNAHQIYFRTADQPWGQWSEPRVLFDDREAGSQIGRRCDPSGCVGPAWSQELTNYHSTCAQPAADWSHDPTMAFADTGNLYGAYVIPRYTQWSEGVATLYFVISTFNPYTVQLMSVKLTTRNVAGQLTDNSGFSIASDVALAPAGGGGLLAVARATPTNYIVQKYKASTAGSWTSWSALGTAPPVGFAGAPYAMVLPNNGLLVVARDASGAVWSSVSPSLTVPAWTPWQSLGAQGGGAVSDLTGALDKDGNPNVFFLAHDGNVWTCMPSAFGGGSCYVLQPGPGNGTPLAAGAIVGKPVAIKESDGHIEVFARGVAGNISHIWQGPNASGQTSWQAWASRGMPQDPQQHQYPLQGDPSAFHDAFGSLQIVARDQNNHADVMWKTSANGPWSSTWKDLAGDIRSNPVAQLAQDGKSYVFALGADNHLWRTSTIAAGANWTFWGRVEGPLGYVGNPTARLLGYSTQEPNIHGGAVASDNRLEVVTRAQDGNGIWISDESDVGESF